MASYVGVFHLLAAILLFTFVVQKCPLVNGDQALINRVCSKTGNKNKYCLGCFNTPASRNQDIKGLAKTSVLCASSTSFNTRQATQDLAKRSTGQLKQDLNKAVGILDQTLGEYADAIQNLGFGRYPDAINQLRLAKNKVLDAINLLGLRFLPSDLPSDVVNAYATLEGDSEVAVNVVSQVP